MIAGAWIRGRGKGRTPAGAVFGARKDLGVALQAARKALSFRIETGTKETEARDAKNSDFERVFGQEEMRATRKK